MIWVLVYLLESDVLGSVQHGSIVLEGERSGKESHRLPPPGSELRSSPHEGSARSSTTFRLCWLACTKANLTARYKRLFLLC